MSAQSNNNATSTEPDARQKEVHKRLNQANDLNDAAQAYYEDFWDAKNIADVETDAGKFSHRAESKTTLQILEYADVDTIVDTYAEQIFVQEKVVQHDTNGDTLLIRCDNGSETVASEADRLRAARDDPTVFTPGVIGFGRADTETSFRWFWLLDVAAFVDAWMDDDDPCAPTDVYHNSDGTTSLMFAPDVLARSGAVMETWGDTPDRIRKQVDNGDDRALNALLSAGGDA